MTPQFNEATFSTFTNTHGAEIKLATIKTSKKMPAAFWDESPVTEEDLTSYFAHEHKYVETHINGMPKAMKDAGKVKAVVSLPGRRSAHIGATTNTKINNPATKESRMGTVTTMVVKTDKPVYNDALKDLIKSLEA